MQDRNGLETCNRIVYTNLNKKAALKKLKPRNHIGDAKNTIINNIMARKEELEEICQKDSECKHPSFIIRQRNNFYYKSFTRSPMHDLELGLACSITSITYEVTSLLDAKKELSASIKISMEDLVKTCVT